MISALITRARRCSRDGDRSEKFDLVSRVARRDGLDAHRLIEQRASENLALTNRLAHSIFQPCIDELKLGEKFFVV